MVEYFKSKFHPHLLIGSFQSFFWRNACRRFHRGIHTCGFFKEGIEFWELLKILNVNFLWIRLEGGPAAISYLVTTSAGAHEKTCSLKINACPGHSVIQNRLRTAWKKIFALCRCKIEMVGNSFSVLD